MKNDKQNIVQHIFCLVMIIEYICISIKTKLNDWMTPDQNKVKTLQH